MFESIEANIFQGSKQTDKDAWLTTLATQADFLPTITSTIRCTTTTVPTTNLQ